MNDIFVKYPKTMKKELENNEYLEHIHDSMVDLKPIYRVKMPIPDGYEFINLQVLENVIGQEKKIMMDAIEKITKL